MAKPYLDINQQIQNLISNKGLIINDAAYARQKLTDISYVSLIGGYKVPFINPMTRKYVGNTTFEDIVALYKFDKDLRLLTFGCITTVEEKLRQLIDHDPLTGLLSKEGFRKRVEELLRAYPDTPYFLS